MISKNAQLKRIGTRARVNSPNDDMVIEPYQQRHVRQIIEEWQGYYYELKEKGLLPEFCQGCKAKLRGLKPRGGIPKGFPKDKPRAPTDEEHTNFLLMLLYFVTTGGNGTP